MINVQLDSFNDVKLGLQTAFQENDTDVSFFCTLQNTNLMLIARLYHNRDYGVNEACFFSIFLYRGITPIFDSEAVYTVRGVIEAFDNFSNGFEDAQFYITEKAKDNE